MRPATKGKRPGASVRVWVLKFYAEVKPTHARTAWSILELVFHGAVHNVRKSHTSAVIGLLLNIVQSVLMLAGFYLMFAFTGTRHIAIRGDYILYLMSGIFMYMTHVKAMQTVMKADGPTSAMMKHGPMNTLIAVGAAALGALYLQILSALVVLFIYHAIFSPITIDQPIQTLGMMVLAWATGVAIGMIFRAATPWQPRFFGILSTVYARLNMIASGKMFVANAMPTIILGWFDWNPLFHIIDQGRGFIFLNYLPRYSNVEYPLYFLLACLIVGLMGEFYTMKRVSLSWTMGK